MSRSGWKLKKVGLKDIKNLPIQILEDLGETYIDL